MRLSHLVMLLHLRDVRSFNSCKSSFRIQSVHAIEFFYPISPSDSAIIFRRLVIFLPFTVLIKLLSSDLLFKNSFYCLRVVLHNQRVP